MRNTIIYSLNDPITGEIRYIGKTKQRLSTRLSRHVKEANIYNNHKCCWIKSLLNKNLKPIIQELDILTSEEAEEWIFWEIFWINWSKYYNLRLTNSTAGGEGSTGCKFPNRKSHSKETRLKISKANKLVPRTKEWIDKVRQANKKPIICIDNNIIIKYESATDAAIKLGNINYKKNINACLKGKRKSAYGFKWQYENIEFRDKQL